ncbi:Uncharacterised protein [Slackia heliotrinireducens]|uniref:Uncharacterized protein n=1 Tax=Slackia heliotrinireducens (strain ATCC 29202 / DSM 20476 / NCTC 11029 / RHS 1) TaxID=471855 RepID=C7N6P7_SLAHD|nr:hypothetical protein [Slackia heliotrinireducens]ACV22582.1 hypothetical protein Shel_15630 [Slackia heliotrinireducens DSM 20476]VEH01073.1 Uncharacterised protein [Slackia heliotrinireducens]
MADLYAAAKSGNRRKTLECLRDELARTIAVCDSGRDMAALSKRLMEVMDEIDGLPKPRGESPLAKARRNGS